MNTLRIVHPQLDLDLGLPPAPRKFVCPASPKDHTILRTSKGIEKKRFIQIKDACAIMGGCDQGVMRGIIRTGLIYAYKTTDRPDSWFKIDSVGVYLYRENQRRRTIGQPPTQQGVDYSAHMQKLNTADPEVFGPPPIPQ